MFKKACIALSLTTSLIAMEVEKHHPESSLPGVVWWQITKHLDIEDTHSIISTHKGLRESKEFWQNAFPHVKSPTDFLGLALYLRREFNSVFSKRYQLTTQQSLLSKLNASFCQPFVDSLMGYLHMEADEHSNALFLLLKPETIISPIPRRDLNRAVYTREIKFSDEISLRYFKEQADKGDEDAQECLNEAAYKGRYGFTTKTSRSYLENQIFQHNDLNAQRWLNRAAFKGKLEFDATTGLNYLKERASQHGDLNAQQWLNKAAFEEKLGFDADTGWFYLKERASRYNDSGAQMLINKAAYDGTHGFKNAYAKGRRTYFRNRIKKGDTHAEHLWNMVYVNGMLDLKGNRGYLESRVLIDNSAQAMLNYAAFEGKLAFTVTTGRKYLESRMLVKDKNAISWMFEAAAKQRLWFSRESGTLFLKEYAAVGYRMAQLNLNTPWFFHFYNEIREH